MEVLGLFLEGILLFMSVESKEEEGGDMVKFMIMYASKGLEFNSVFIFGVEEGLIFFVCNGDSEDD